MRAKYKLESFVKFENGHGEVTGVIMNKDGYSYEIDNGTHTVVEGEITAAFRAIVPRGTKKAKSVKSVKNQQAKAKSQETQASAS